MTREIKFRAYNCLTKEFQHWESGTLNLDVTPLNQYTGLKDKNGVEIYEGDILQDVDTPEWRYAVKWGYSEWRMALRNGLQTDMFRRSSGKQYQYEVIGNIYENPELLDSPTTE